MMPAALWTTLAVAGMIAIFGGCVIVVVAGIRLIESVRDKRRRKEAA